MYESRTPIYIVYVHNRETKNLISHSHIGRTLHMHYRICIDEMYCVIPQIYVDVAKIDGSLTSCIAISFLFNALVDAKLLPERTFSTS